MHHTNTRTHKHQYRILNVQDEVVSENRTAHLLTQMGHFRSAVQQTRKCLCTASESRVLVSYWLCPSRPAEAKCTFISESHLYKILLARLLLLAVIHAFVCHSLAANCITNYICEQCEQTAKETIQTPIECYVNNVGCVG